MMKTPIRKLTLAALGLFVAGMLIPGLTTPAQAAAKMKQNTKQMIQRNTKKKSNITKDGLVANTAEKWYLEFTPAYVSTSGDLDKFYGASVALGWRITQGDKIQLEIGCFTSRNYSGAFSYVRDGTNGGKAEGVFYYGGTAGVNTGSPFRVDNQGYAIPLGGTRSAKATMIPVLISYSYCIRLDARDNFQLRLTPTIGFIDMTDKWSLDASGSFAAPNGTIIDSVSPADCSTISPDGTRIDRKESFGGRDSNYLAFTMGGSFAFTYNLAPRWYVEAGHRYLWLAKATNKQNLAMPTGTPWNGVNAWNGANAHFYSLTLGWRF